MNHKVKINHPNMNNAEIIVDGHDIAPLIKGYTLTAAVREGARLQVDFTPVLMPEWDGLAEIEIPEELAAVLVLFGWQPPVKGEVTEWEISTMGGPERLFLRSDGTYRTEPWHVPDEPTQQEA